jgi:hypothetical protein
MDPRYEHRDHQPHEQNHNDHLATQYDLLKWIFRLPDQLKRATRANRQLSAVSGRETSVHEIRSTFPPMTRKVRNAGDGRWVDRSCGNLTCAVPNAASCRRGLFTARDQSTGLCESRWPLGTPKGLEGLRPALLIAQGSRVAHALAGVTNGLRRANGWLPAPGQQL